MFPGVGVGHLPGPFQDGMLTELNLPKMQVTGRGESGEDDGQRVVSIPACLRLQRPDGGELPRWAPGRPPGSAVRRRLAPAVLLHRRRDRPVHLAGVRTARACIPRRLAGGARTPAPRRHCRRDGTAQQLPDRPQRHRVFSATGTSPVGHRAEFAWVGNHRQHNWAPLLATAAGVCLPGAPAVLPIKKVRCFRAPRIKRPVAKQPVALPPA